MTKPIHWVSMARWMNLTLEEHRRLDAYCRDMGLELGIDVIGDRDARIQIELQKDKDDERGGDWTR